MTADILHVDFAKKTLVRREPGETAPPAYSATQCPLFKEYTRDAMALAEMANEVCIAPDRMMTIVIGEHPEQVFGGFNQDVLSINEVVASLRAFADKLELQRPDPEAV